MKGIGIQLIDSTDIGNIGDVKIDVKKDSEGKIITGLSIGATLNQNKALLLMLQPGELKNHPTLGVGIGDALNSDNLIGYRNKIRRDFADDGLNITELDLYDLKKVSIIANY
jgi:hypothetical protein